MKKIRKPASQLVSCVTAYLTIISLLCGFTGGVMAHEIPSTVVVQTMLQPNANELNLLVRVPLEAMRDVNFPETGPGYLVISEADQTLRDAATIWVAQEFSIFEDGRQLTDWEIAAVRLDLPSDRSFQSWDAAFANVMSPPLEDGADLMRNQALLDVLIRYPITSPQSEFSIAPAFSRLGLQTTTVVRYLDPDGVERVFQFSGDPGVLVLDPRWHHAFFRFVKSGVAHILDGTDHLLFILCLLIPFRRIRPLVVVITSFTIAHSMTLLASAFGMVPNFLWFPPLIETLIAASIVYMAFENIIGAKWRKRWLIAFGFGLVHGFGFSFALGENLQFAGGHLLTSLLAFNIGVEIGQVFVILLAVPLLNLLFKHVVSERLGTILLSALIVHTSWHWMTDRAEELFAYSFELPALNSALFAALSRWLMLLVVISVVVWVLLKLYRRFLAADEGDTAIQ